MSSRLVDQLEERPSPRAEVGSPAHNTFLDLEARVVGSAAVRESDSDRLTYHLYPRGRPTSQLDLNHVVISYNTPIELSHLLQ